MTTLQKQDFPKITIITPSFNQGQYIEDTILSIINQGYPNLEYIIIDGGSTDNTVEVINKYKDRIDFWVSEKDTGQSNAINKGFQKATGDIINWINSDDQLLPGALVKVAELFSQHPEAILVHGRIEYFGETSTFYSKNIPAKDIQTRYVSHICMPQPACFYRKKLLDEQGLLDESLHFSMDTDLFVRAGLHYTGVQVNDIFSRFRLHQASKSVSAFNKNFLKDNAAIFSKALTTLGADREIEKMKTLGLYSAPASLYNKPVKQFDTKKMLFYFLQHRLFTLHNHKENKDYKKIFSFLLQHYPWKTIASFKLVIYRVLLFLPKGFLHGISKLILRKG